ncbi:hypothetical protein AAJ76_600005344 [Vairimorpha ceranae]|uniref:Uncharacterized protein n=1 Tax=Vairimorpha ceranae TaxID=40302 RepID=A0A0F9WCI9_9MICR|nr:hypothetical protein AAJ76_600005344 [Vairimorpha ceranae]KKO74550.1 hypothetical protein AAJ76_600005344 [Vairimorpha ceranae]
MLSKGDYKKYKAQYKRTYEFLEIKIHKNKVNIIYLIKKEKI